MKRLGKSHAPKLRLFSLHFFNGKSQATCCYQVLNNNLCVEAAIYFNYIFFVKNAKISLNSARFCSLSEIAFLKSWL